MKMRVMSGGRSSLRAGATTTRATCSQATRLVTTCKESRIGKKPVPVGMTEDNSAIKFTKREETRKSKQLHGLCRSLGQNMVTGVIDGWKKNLSLIGVGYRASMKGSKQLELSLGFIHPVILDLPEGVKVTVDKSQTAIEITGYDKEVVGNFAAIVRSKRPPEVYKGKGIRYVDEYVRMKEGKAGKK